MPGEGCEQDSQSSLCVIMVPSPHPHLYHSGYHIIFKVGCGLHLLCRQHQHCVSPISVPQHVGSSQG